MIEFKTETEEKIVDKNKLLPRTTVTIIHETACQAEIKIENEEIRHYNYKENVDNLSISHRYPEQCTSSKGSNVLDNYENHPCNTCNIRFTFRRKLAEHLRQVHGTYRCDVDDCCEEFQDHKKLINHKKDRHGLFKKKKTNPSKIYECQFENCNFKCKSSAGLRYHTLRHSEKSHICNVCSKAFFELSDLKQHSYSHTGERPFPCKKCPKAFVTSAKLRDHYYSHIGVKPYHCRFCEKEFSQALGRRVHERLHTKERPFVCEVCQKSFASYTVLYSHKATHSDKRRYTCKVCQKSFRQMNHLNQHERIHTGEKPFCCDVCDHRFSQIGHLRTHLKTHIRGKPFSCTTCQSTFSFKSQLTAHERIHSGDPVFICALCDKTYFEKRSLRVHLQKCYNQRTYKSTSDIQEGNVILRITRQQNPQ